MSKMDEVKRGFAVLNLAMSNSVTAPDNELTNTEDFGRGLEILIGGMLIDLARIADAVEKLASIEGVRLGNEYGVEDLQTIGLTPEEIETIEALRRGDIRVHVVPVAPAQPEPDPTYIKWYGGLHENAWPVTLGPGDRVTVQFRNGQLQTNWVSTFDWRWHADVADIMAYSTD